MDKTLGQRIRELREERDISLREFARRLDGLSAAHVSDIELGRRFPSEDVLLKMAHVLHVDVAELKKLDSRPPVEEMRRRAEADPAYGIALRRMVERDVKPEDILKAVDKKSKEDLK
jgi:transcriptional regulator with XRE-family HTH domain